MLYQELSSVAHSKYEIHLSIKTGSQFSLNNIEGDWEVTAVFQAADLATAQSRFNLQAYKQIFDANMPKSNLYQDSSNGTTVYILAQEVKAPEGCPQLSILNDLFKWLASHSAENQSVVSGDGFEMDDILLYTDSDEQNPHEPIAISESDIRYLNEYFHKRAEFMEYAFKDYMNEKLLIFLLLPTSFSSKILNLVDFNRQFPLSVFAQNDKFADFLISPAAFGVINQLVKDINALPWLGAEVDRTRMVAEIHENFSQYRWQFTVKNNCRKFYESTLAKYNQPFADYFFSLEETVLLYFDNALVLREVEQVLLDNLTYQRAEQKLKSIDSALSQLPELGLNSQGMQQAYQYISEFLAGLDCIKFNERFNLTGDMTSSDSVSFSAENSPVEIVVHCLTELDNKLHFQMNLVQHENLLNEQAGILQRNMPLLYEAYFSFASIVQGSIENITRIYHDLKCMNESLSADPFLCKRLKTVFEKDRLLNGKGPDLKPQFFEIIRKLIKSQPFDLEVVNLERELIKHQEKKALLNDISDSILQLGHKATWISDILKGFHTYYDFDSKSIEKLHSIKNGVQFIADQAKMTNSCVFEFEQMLKEYARVDLGCNTKMNRAICKQLLLTERTEAEIRPYFNRSLILLLNKKIELKIQQIEVDTNYNIEHLMHSLNLALADVGNDIQQLKKTYSSLNEFLVYGTYFKKRIFAGFITSIYDEILNEVPELHNFYDYNQLESSKKEACIQACKDAYGMAQRRVNIASKLALLESLKVNDSDYLLLDYLEARKQLNNSPKATCIDLINLQVSLTSLETCLTSNNYRQSLAKIELLASSRFNYSAEPLRSKLLATDPFKRHTLSFTSKIEGKNISLFFAVDPRATVKPSSPVGLSQSASPIKNKVYKPALSTAF